MQCIFTTLREEKGNCEVMRVFNNCMCTIVTLFPQTKAEKIKKENVSSFLIAEFGQV